MGAGVNAMPSLPIDGAQLAAFLDATCRYAEPETYLSLRAFFDDESKLYFAHGRQIGADPAALLPEIEELAGRCTRPARPIVFAPPLATFIAADAATEAALANGLTLSVECDSRPQAART